MGLQECSFIADHPENPYPTVTADFATIGSIGDLEAVAEGSVWQDFERLAAFIFEENGFQVSVGTVKTRQGKRRQYDVIARKNGRTFLVECKQWSGSRYRLSALKRAVLQHRERVAFYGEIMQADAVPVIVTLIEEEIRVFEGVPLVPVHRLNAFISELDGRAEGFSPAYEDEEFADDWPEEPGWE
jgi:Holliday junction resolvase